MQTLETKPADHPSHAVCGRGYEGFEVGTKIKSLDEIRTGDVLIYLTLSQGRLCANAVVCLRTAAAPMKFGEIAYFQFLHGSYAPGGIALWQWSLASVDLYRAICPTAEAGKLMELFRRHAMTSSGYAFGAELPAPIRVPLPPEVARIPNLQVKINPKLK